MITLLIIMLLKYRKLAYFDGLTGLHNRTYYNRVIKTKYLSKDIYVYYIDVDGLKHINDAEGHAAGSALLKSVAEELANNINLIEVARIGGDEFIAISKNKVELTIEGTSIGVQHKEIYEDVSSSIHKADEAMYRIKEIHHKRIS